MKMMTFACPRAGPIRSIGSQRARGRDAAGRAEAQHRAAGCRETRKR